MTPTPEAIELILGAMAFIAAPIAVLIWAMRCTTKSRAKGRIRRRWESDE